MNQRFRESDSSPLNTDFVRQLIELQQQTQDTFLEQMLGSFIEERNLFFKKLPTALSENSQNQADAVIHRFKGAADAMGMSKLSLKCKQELTNLRADPEYLKQIADIQHWQNEISESITSWTRMTGNSISH